MNANIGEVWSSRLYEFSLWGYALLALYIVVALAAARKLARLARAPVLDRGALIVWTGVFFVLVALLFGRVFSLDILLALAGRCAALDEGWYADRRGWQGVVVLVIALVGAGLAALAIWMRKAADERMALTGAAMLLAFTAARSVSLHQIDAVLGATILGFRFNGVVEAAGLALVFAAALLPDGSNKRS